ncbi:MAG: RHS repeat-associated core domain-containing protein [Vicinamibacterales bacterium]
MHERRDGASRTLLPDGRVLQLGGRGSDGALADVSIEDPDTGQLFTPASTMRVRRTGHSATVMADGTVLIVGGVGANGEPAEGAEVFDPALEQFRDAPVALARPRTGHAVALLSDGRVLVVGGERTAGREATLEVWDLAAGTVALVPWQSRDRQALAQLRSDGTVLIGRSHADDLDGDSFDPATGRVAPAHLGPDGGPTRQTHLAGSIPSDGSRTVPVGAVISLRFSRPLPLRQLNSDAFTLAGPAGVVAVRVVGAADGQLAFVRPLVELDFDSSYTLRTQYLQDADGAAVPIAPITFATEPAPDSSDASDAPWVPDAQSGWQVSAAPSPWESMKPLMARPGETALSGRTLRLDGTPLSGVALTIDGHRARTDGTGRFLIRLDEAAAGHEEMWVDGRPASSGSATYGTYEIGVELVAGRTTVLPYTVWMGALDTAHAVTIESPTRSAYRIATPLIPGLELRLPAGTVIRDHEGQPVTRVSITPVPLNRPPFPLPVGVEVPIYFTVQPGGAYIYVPASSGVRGGQLAYPNGLRLPRESTIDFWQYSPDGQGWHVYGQGTVTPDGSQILPNPSTAIYEFTGAMVGLDARFAPAVGPRVADPNGADGEPVDLSTGLFVHRKTDLTVHGLMPLHVDRAYRPADARMRPFGIGSSHEYEVFLMGSANPWTYIDVVLEDGARIHFDRTSPGTGWFDAIYTHTQTPSRFYMSSIRWQPSTVLGHWRLTFPSGDIWMFAESSAATAPSAAGLIGILDRFGNRIDVERSGPYASVSRVSTSNGRYIAFDYDSSNRVIRLTDNAGRTVSYTYDALGRLWKVTNPEGGMTQYTYDASHRMVTITDERGVRFLSNEYDASDRVVRQTLTDGAAYAFAYTTDAQGRVVRTDVTNPRGMVRRTSFNTAGYSMTVVDATGTPLERTRLRLERATGSNLITAETDALGRRTETVFDVLGNVVQTIRLTGTPDAVATRYEYEPRFQERTAVVDPLGHRWTWEWDPVGTPLGSVDPLGHRTRVQVNSAGQITQVTDPFGSSWTASYVNGDLASVTDPLGRTVTQFVDAAGRRLAGIDPLGARSTVSLDGLGRPMASTDHNGASTQYQFDQSSLLTTVTDARGQNVLFDYDDSNRLTRTTDPLGVSEVNAYDLNGNRITQTDRRGLETHREFDLLDRLSRVTFDGGSTVSYVYDAGDRLVRISDSQNGTIERVFDNLDRMVSEVTPEGSVSYTYDLDGRRTSMTIDGQGTTAYTFDAGHHLVGVASPTVTVAMTYDDLGRRASVTYDDGLVQTFAYDAAGQMTRTGAMQADTNLGFVTYDYDAAGRRTAANGPWARVALPEAVGSASYDGANRVGTWGGRTFLYDPAGNLLSDGLRSYLWDDRNQLVAVSGSGGASYQYDAVARRRSITVGATVTDLLFDGADIVVERGGATATQRINAGLDQTLARTTGTSTTAMLRDALGSTVAEAEGGVLISQYTYEPFGRTSMEGRSHNRVAFGGRDNDPVGLYHLRARYLEPETGRFISEDPLRWRGGDPSAYGYASNSPTNLTDPTGLIPIHGNWCGPSWTGGRVGTYNPAMDNVYEAPVDGLDRLCKSHDQCYAQCRDLAPCNAGARNSCMKGCDGTLFVNYVTSTAFAFDMIKMPIGLPLPGIRGAAIVEGVYLHVSAEPNASTCRCPR